MAARPMPPTRRMSSSSRSPPPVWQGQGTPLAEHNHAKLKRQRSMFRNANQTYAQRKAVAAHKVVEEARHVEFAIQRVVPYNLCPICQSSMGAHSDRCAVGRMVAAVTAYEDVSR